MAQLKRTTFATFWTLTGVFVIVLCQLFVSPFGELLRGKVFLIPMALFCLLGVALLILSLREKVEERLKRFLILTGASATGFFVFVVLHNLFYALGMITGEIFILNYLIKGLQVAFFLIAIFVCPAGFLTGAAGTIFLVKKNR